MRNRLKAAVASAPLAAFLLVIFAAEVAIALGYPRDPRLFPVIIGSAGVALCLLQIFDSAAAPGPLPGSGEPATAREPLPWLPVATPIAFGAGLWLFGFWVTLGVGTPALISRLGERRPVVLIAATGGILLLALGMFGLIRAEVPQGIVTSSFLRAFR